MEENTLNLKQNDKKNYRNRFLSDLSHDIRTPINGLLGMCSVGIMNIDDKEKVLECLHKMQLLSKSLLNQVNNAFDLSQIEVNKLALQSNDISFKSLIKEIIEISNFEVNRKSQYVYIQKMDIQHDNVLGDEQRIKQVCLKILSNMEKYSTEEEVVEIQIEELKGEKVGYAHFLILYNKKPLACQKSEEIFKNNIEIPVVKGILNQMNGSILVENQVQGGVTVRIEFELKVKSEDSSINNSIDKVSCTKERNYKGNRFLIAEDNEINMELLSCMLEAIGAEVFCVFDGNDAIEAFKNHEEGYFDIILMDVQMPIMNGYEATERIRNMNRKDSKTIPIFAVTANSFHEDIDKAMQAGMNEHIAKPVNFDNLLGIMTEYI